MFDSLMQYSLVVGSSCVALVVLSFILVKIWTGRVPSLKKLLTMFGVCFIIAVVQKFFIASAWALLLGSLLWPFAVSAVLIHGIIVATDRYLWIKYGYGIFVPRKLLSVLIVYVGAATGCALMARYASVNAIRHVEEILTYAIKCGALLLASIVIWTGNKIPKEEVEEIEVQEDQDDHNYFAE